MESLRNANIGCAVYYPVPLHLQPCFQSLGHTPGDFPETERACDEVLSLPLYAEIPEAHQHRVVSGLADAIQSGSTITFPEKSAPALRAA